MTAPGQTDDDDNIEFGGAEDDVEDNDEGTEGSEDEAPALREDGKPYTASDIRALQDALKKNRKELRALKSAKPPADEDKTPDADAEARAAQAAEAKFKPVVVRTAAKAAFVEAGLVLPKGKGDAALARALKLLDMAEVEITDDGEVEGLDDQIEEIKSEFPELFVSTRRPGRVDGAGREGSDNGKPKSSADKIASLLG